MTLPYYLPTIYPPLTLSPKPTYLYSHKPQSDLQISSHKATNNPSTPTNPAAATGTCVGTAKPLLAPAPPAAVEPGAEPDEPAAPVAEAGALVVYFSSMVVPFTIWAGTLVTTAEPLLAVAVRGMRVTLLPRVLLVPASRVPLLPARRVLVGWVCGVGSQY